MFWILLLLAVWSIYGLVYMVVDLDQQCKEIPPHNWWGWVIMFPLMIVVMCVIIIGEFVSALAYILGLRRDFPD
jgi:uncharacterized protein with PQ loop repeat